MNGARVMKELRVGGSAGPTGSSGAKPSAFMVFAAHYLVNRGVCVCMCGRGAGSEDIPGCVNSRRKGTKVGMLNTCGGN